MRDFTKKYFHLNSSAVYNSSAKNSLKHLKYTNKGKQLCIKSLGFLLKLSWDLCSFCGILQFCGIFVGFYYRVFCSIFSGDFCRVFIRSLHVENLVRNYLQPLLPLLVFKTVTNHSVYIYSTAFNFILRQIGQCLTFQNAELLLLILCFQDCN